jgi:hypothetical protein
MILGSIGYGYDLETYNLANYNSGSQEYFELFNSKPKNFSKRLLLT